MDEFLAGLRARRQRGGYGGDEEGGEDTLLFQILDVHVRDGAAPSYDADTPLVLQSDVGVPSMALGDEDSFGQRRVVPECVVYVFGKTKRGSSVCAAVSGFRPWFRVELPGHANVSHAGRLQSELQRKFWLKPGDVSAHFEWRHRMYGWVAAEGDSSARRKFPFVRVSFPNVRIARAAAAWLEATPLDVMGDGRPPRLLPLADTKVDASQRFMDACGARASGWVALRAPAAPAGGKRVSVCDYEVACALGDVEARPQEDGIAPLLVCATDIEVDSRTGDFPHAVCSSGACAASGCPGDQVIFIGSSFWVYGDKEPCASIMLCLGDVAMPPPPQPPAAPGPLRATLCFATELQLLGALSYLVVMSDPDWWTSYNGTSFDYSYMWDRFERLNRAAPSRFPYMSRLVGVRCPLKKKELSSAGTGDNVLSYFPLPGRVLTDLFLNCKTSFKLSSYTLNAVAHEFLPGTGGKVRLDVDGWALAEAESARAAILRLVGGNAGHAAVGFAAAAVAALRAPPPPAVPALPPLVVLPRIEVSEEEEGGGEEAAAEEEEEEEGGGSGVYAAAHALLQSAAAALGGTTAGGAAAFAAEEALRRAMVATGDDNYKKLFAINRLAPHQRAAIVEYAIQDCVLVLQLMNRLSIVPHMSQLSFVTYTPLNDIGNRGQQIRAFNQIFRRGCAEGFAMNAPVSGWAEDEEYEGAHVFPPKRGLYMDPVITLDFASLYPSIMRDRNLCPSTLIIPGSHQPGAAGGGPPSQTHRIGARDWTFVLHVEGVLPAIVKDLLAARKSVRESMKKIGDKESLEYRLLDGRQLALKVSANSVYGFTGAKNGMYPCMPVAAAVTSTGRGMILKTSEFITRTYGGEVIYGDSVSGDSALIVRDARSGLVRTCRIDELASAWEGYRNGAKQQAAAVFTDDSSGGGGEDSELEVWSDAGFTPVRRVIRHAHPQPLRRVLTRTGLVDCTADHSLLRPDGHEVRPTDVRVGEQLLHAPPPAELLRQGDCEDGITTGVAFGMGLFAARGFWNGAGAGTWAIRCTGLSRFGGAMMWGLFPFGTWLDTVAGGKGDGGGGGELLRTKSPAAAAYARLFYNGHAEKRVPACMLNASLEVAAAFFDGFCAAATGEALSWAAERRRIAHLVLEEPGKELCAGLWLLAAKLGFKGVRIRPTAAGLFAMKFQPDTTLLPSAGGGEIRQLGLAPPAGGGGDAFVYDLETEAHHFHVGPGNLVVHNTDSIMATFGPMSMEDAFARGLEAAAGATALFPGGKVKLEFEKVYKPYWIFMKKRYAALKYEGDPRAPPKMDVKGIAVVRRDNCALVRQVINAVLVSVLQGNDLPGALGVVRLALARLQRKEVSVADLCITKALRAPEKYVDQHHEQLVVVKKMTARREFGVPRTGDRVKYVITSSPEPRICDRADDPQHVQRAGLPLDLMYYLNNQLMKPVLALFASLPPQLAELNAMFEAARAQVQRELDGIGSLAALCPGAAPLAVRSAPPKRKGRATLIPAGAVTASLSSFLMPSPPAAATPAAATPPGGGEEGGGERAAKQRRG